MGKIGLNKASSIFVYIYLCLFLFGCTLPVWFSFFSSRGRGPGDRGNERGDRRHISPQHISPPDSPPSNPRPALSLIKELTHVIANGVAPLFEKTWQPETEYESDEDGYRHHNTPPSSPRPALSLLKSFIVPTVPKSRWKVVDTNGRAVIWEECRDASWPKGRPPKRVADVDSRFEAGGSCVEVHK